MSIFTTLLLALVALTVDALASHASFLQRWISGCLISVTVVISVVGGVIGIVALGTFIFNL